MATIGSLKVSLQLATTRFEKGVQQAQKSLGGLGKTASGVGTHIKAMMGIGSAVGFGVMIKKSLDYQNSLVDLSDRLGVTVEGLSRLHHAAKLTGVSQETMNMALQRMTRRVAEAGQGTGEAVKALDELGISAQRLGQLTPDQQFQVLADAIESVEDPADKVRLSMKLFDSEGVKLLQTMKGGSAALREMGEASDAAGATVSQKAALAARQANAAFIQMGAASTGLANTMAVQLGPTVAEIATWMSNKLPSAIEFTKNAFKILSAGVVGVIENILSFYGRLFEVMSYAPGAIGDFWQEAANKTQQAAADLRGTQDVIFESIRKGSEAQNQFAASTDNARFALENFKLANEETNAALSESNQNRSLAEFERLQQELLTEEEKIRESYLRRQEIILANTQENEALRDELLQKIEKDREQRLLDHQAKLGNIEAQGAIKRLKFEQMTSSQKTKTILGDMVTLTSGVAQNSRKMFELNKAAALANAVVAMPDHISKTMAAYPYPISIGMGALAAAASLAQINAIRSSSFTGGGGGTTPSSAGTAPSINSQPVLNSSSNSSLGSGQTSGDSDSQQAVGTTINIYGDVHGNDAEVLVDQLKTLINDGDHVIIESTSRQAQELIA